jgi:nitrate reductase gamma subunit
MSHRSTLGRLLNAVAMAVALSAPMALFSVGEAAADAADSKKIFTQRCMACHSFGKGVKIGPDLRGVTERRPRPWLVKFIRSSQSMISSGDPVAVALFQQFKQQQMPDWLDLSEAQIGALLDWLAANGPDQREGDSRLAPSATAAEIENGKQLFHGVKALSMGGTACAACHVVVDDDGARAGGALGPDLTTAYALYQEGAFTQVLKRPCTARMPEAAGDGFLTSDETFALKAYLYQIGNARARDERVSDKGDGRGETRSADGGTGTGTGTGAGTKSSASPPPPMAPRPARWRPQLRAGGPTVGTAAAGGELLFGALPYAALGLFFLGMAVRYGRGRRTAGALAAEAKEAWRSYRGERALGLAWRVGLLGTALAHLIGLAAPRAVASWAAAPWRLYLLEATGLLFGVLLLGGVTILLGKALLRDDTTAGSRRPLADCLFLSGLFVAVLSGLATALLYRWGSLWSAGTMTPYLQSLARGAPMPGLIEQLPLLVRIHVVAWLVLVALAPGTSAAALALHGVDRLLALSAPPLAALGRAADRARARLSPAAWLWPEEDRGEPLAAAEAEQTQSLRRSP